MSVKNPKSEYPPASPELAMAGRSKSETNLNDQNPNVLNEEPFAKIN
jgi:hypothetical protein